MTVTAQPTLRQIARQTDDLISKIDASMARMDALTERLNAQWIDDEPDGEWSDEETDDEPER